MPLGDVVPPLAHISPAVAAQMAEQPLIPLSVSGARQFFLSWRHGRLEVREPSWRRTSLHHGFQRLGQPDRCVFGVPEFVALQMHCGTGRPI